MNATEIAKKIVPHSGLIYLKTVNKKIKEITYFINEQILSFVSISPLLSSLYYAFISPQFRREHHAVIKGKLAYNKSLKSSNNNYYQLRRNIHRLEKGLIMRPRRNIFALDYIEETVDNYSKLVTNNTNPSDNQDLNWAHDVLNEYFKVVGSHPIIEKSKTIFSGIQPLNQEFNRIPYLRDSHNSLSINYEQFLELCYRRRSVRWYEQKPVPRELIDKAIIAASLSPSACNRQPFEFRVFDDPEQVKIIGKLPWGTKGFNDNFPTIVVVIGKLRAYFSERDRHIIYIDASLASMSFMFALETLGISSCPINWPDIENSEKKMSKLLKLESDERPIMLISLGYPDSQGLIPYSQKKHLSDIRRYN